MKQAHECDFLRERNEKLKEEKEELRGRTAQLEKKLEESQKEQHRLEVSERVKSARELRIRGRLQEVRGLTQITTQELPPITDQAHQD